MDEKNNNEGQKVDEVLLPGFRFHPTDEELVGFYLKRKIQQRPLAIELIKQLDIYKFDPWDLPKFASTGEKEWYFYCPRDRKYRNSARPNRVTGAGFWKATGTDRPIYSTEGNKCIGLKKSLVFYKGRAAKGVKTDWMMHEFRLPSLGDSTLSKRCVDKNLPTNDSWAICRIFKKTGPITSRTHSHSWVSPLPGPSHLNLSSHPLASSSCNNPNLSPENTTKTSCSTPMQPNSSNNINDLETFLQSPNNFSFLDHIPTFKPIYPTTSGYNADNTTSHDNNLFPNIATLLDFPPSYILPPLEDPSEQSKSNNNIDISSMLLNMSSSVLENFNKHLDGNVDFSMLPNINGQCHDFGPITMSQVDLMQHVNVEDNHIHDNIGDDQQDFACTLIGNHLNNMLYAEDEGHHQWNGIQTIGSIPITDLLPLAMPEAWKTSSSLIWDCAPPLS